MIRPMPVIPVTTTTRVVCRAAPWRAWVNVYRGFSFSHAYTFDPPYKRLMDGGPDSKRGPWVSRPS